MNTPMLESLQKIERDILNLYDQRHVPDHEKFSEMTTFLKSASIQLVQALQDLEWMRISVEQRLKMLPKDYLKDYDYET